MELYEASRAQSPTAEPRSRPIREADHDRACERPSWSSQASLSPQDRLIRSDRGKDSGRLVWTASDEWPVMPRSEVSKLTWGRLLPKSGEPRLLELPSSARARHMLPASGIYPRVRLSCLPAWSSTDTSIALTMDDLGCRYPPLGVYICVQSRHWRRLPAGSRLGTMHRRQGRWASMHVTRVV